MLIKNFYTINSKSIQDDGSVIFNISLNQNHDVYKGHFPEKPITPGVCNIQMIKECCQQAKGKNFVLKSIDRCRLTAMVTPNESPNLNVKISFDATDESKINASIFKGEVVYMSLVGTLAEK